MLVLIVPFHIIFVVSNKETLVLTCAFISHANHGCIVICTNNSFHDVKLYLIFEEVQINTLIRMAIIIIELLS